MENLNNSSVNASDMVPEVSAISISQNYSFRGKLVIYVFKSNENMKNLNSSCVKASDTVSEVFVGPISQNYSWQFFFLILV